MADKRRSTLFSFGIVKKPRTVTELCQKKRASYAKAAVAAKSLAISNAGKKIIAKKFKKACRTRWLSTEMAIAGVYEDFIPLTQTLRVYKEDNDSTAIDLLKQVRNVKFLSTVYLLHEVLPALSHLSKAFQRGTISFSAIDPAIKYTIDQLREIATSQKPLEKLKKDLGEGGRLSISEVKLTSFNEQYLRNLTVKYVGSLTENIENRFAESLPVLSAFKIFDPMAVRCRSDEEFKEYDCALQHILAMRTTYEHFIPGLLRIAEVCLSLPVSNAWPERGASAVKRLKTRLRSSIKNDMLEALMHVTINGPDVSECGHLIEATVKKWCINRKKLAKGKPKAQDADNTSVIDAAVQTDLVDNESLYAVEELVNINEIQIDNLERDMECLAAKLKFPLNLSDLDSDSDESLNLSDVDSDSEF
ncbi:hypothetical protein QZH41_004302 [Actinostola sp. cb2023]|nr:hypothetical protein QZH41_004302 [Actinostola sp. cb2023]